MSQLYHVYIVPKSNPGNSLIKLGLTREQLVERVVSCYEEGRSITLSGRTISLDDLEQIRISTGTVPVAQLIARAEAEQRNDTVVVVGSAGYTEYLAFSYGEDVTDDFIHGPPGHKRQPYGTKMPHDMLVDVDKANVPRSDMGDAGDKTVHYWLIGIPIRSGKIVWQMKANAIDPVSQNTVTISVSHPGENSEKKALAWLANKLAELKHDWLKPAAHPSGNWIVDLDGLRAEAKPHFDKFSSWTGRAIVRPLYEFEQDIESRLAGNAFSSDRWRVWFTYPKPEDEEDLPMASPGELQPYLEAFRMDHPVASKTGFVMMRFKDTPLQLEAFKIVRDTCAKLGLTALRADYKPYSDDLFPNIRTYMHGCGFGISIFERITEDDFNPNVSLEVGYMLGMGKPVLLLKDRDLKRLQTDLVGRLYEEFDPQRPAETIPAVVEKWLRAKGIVA